MISRSSVATLLNNTATLLLSFRTLITWRKKLLRTRAELEEAATSTETVTEEATTKTAGRDGSDVDEIEDEGTKLRAEIEKDAKRYEYHCVV